MKFFPVGVFVGKMCPPHRGHLNSILQSSTRCEKLYVVVSHNSKLDAELFKDSPLKPMSMKQKARWLSTELSDFEHIEVLMLDETDIPVYPYGWEEWSKLLRQIVPEPFDVIFGGEPSYADEGYTKYFPEVKYELYDTQRTAYPISATEIRKNPFKHWDYILGCARPYIAKKVLLTGTESCVDGDTEYFNGFKWIKIKNYTNEEQVLQYNMDGTSSLVKPIRYIKEPCEKMYKIQNSYKTWSQVYTEDHDLVYKTSKGNLAKKKMKDVMNAHFENSCGFQGKFFSHFIYNGDIFLDSNFLKLSIAISADGTVSRTKWRVRLKKERKIERLRQIIIDCGLELDERIYEDGYHNFYIPIEYGSKIFPTEYLHLTKECKEIFISEVFFWDGHEKDKRYFSTEKKNAEIVQFIFNSTGYKTLWYENNKEDLKTLYTVELSKVKNYTIDINKHNEKHRNEMITEFIPEDGYKYCFTVDSGMLILRRDNYIFITGNCGKTTITKMLAKTFYTSWAREEGRYYSEKYMGKNEDVFTMEDFYNICWEQRQLEEHALKTANKIVFFDTDSIVTQYYTKQYLGEYNPKIEFFTDPNRYDLILMMCPDVKWVEDGLRWLSGDERRWRLHEELKQMYIDRGFKNIIEISGNYNERLNKAIEISKSLIE